MCLRGTDKIGEGVARSFDADVDMVVVRSFVPDDELAAIIEVDSRMRTLFNHLPRKKAEYIEYVSPAWKKLKETYDDYFFVNSGTSSWIFENMGIRKGRHKDHFDPYAVVSAACLNLRNLESEEFSGADAETTFYVRRYYNDSPTNNLREANDYNRLASDPLAAKATLGPGDLVLVGGGVYHGVSVGPVHDKGGESFANDDLMDLGWDANRLAMVGTVSDINRILSLTASGT